jgi:exopolysaccharide production protein ExoQ
MSPWIAAAVYIVGIVWLFILDRRSDAKTSPALWIAVIWITIGASREVAQWFPGVGTGGQPSDVYLEGSPVDRAIYIALLGTALVVLINRGQQTGMFLSINGPILVFFLYGAISVAWSDFPFVAFKRWTKALGNVVMVLVVLTDPDQPAAIKRVFAHSAFLLIPTSVLLIKYFPDIGRGYDQWTGGAMYTGVSTSKNALAWDSLIFGLATLWRFLYEYQARKRTKLNGSLIAHGVVLGMALWLLQMAQSSAALGCFIIGSGIICLAHFRWFVLRPIVMHSIVLSIVSICVFGIIIDTSLGLVEAAGRDATLTDRTLLWADLLQMDINPLFGTGFESFWLGDRLKLIWSKYPFMRPNQAHNGYIETYLTLGWVGLTFLGLMMVWGYRNVVRSLQMDPEFGRLKLALFVVTVILNLTEATFKVMHPVWIIFLLVIMVIPLSATRKEESDGRVYPGGQLPS